MLDLTHIESEIGAHFLVRLIPVAGSLVLDAPIVYRFARLGRLLYLECQIRDVHDEAELISSQHQQNVWEATQIYEPVRRKFPHWASSGYITAGYLTAEEHVYDWDWSVKIMRNTLAYILVPFVAQPPKRFKRDKERLWRDLGVC